MTGTNIPFKLDNSDILKHEAFVDGKWTTAASGKRFEIYDPGNGQAWTSCPAMGAEDVDDVVRVAHTAFQTFRKTNPRTRARLLLKWDALIRANKEDLARILVHETGKPMSEAQGEIDYALGFTWWFAGEAERIQGTVSTPSAPGRRVFTIKQPIGVAVALVPWNFPIAMILRKASAAFAAGCTMVVKPSPETPLTTLTLALLAQQAGFANGVLNVMTTDLANTPGLSEALCKHPLVSKVSFTGSTRVGKIVAKHCAEGLKKVTLELGGNCPFLVFDDADLDQAAEALVLLKFRHAGQACITANRVYVQRGVYDKFAKIVTEKAQALNVGHGIKPQTTMGPLTTQAGVDKTESQVQDAVKHGGLILTGGARPASLNGYFFEPTVIGLANGEMLLAREETFGPICALFRFDTEEEAVKAANDTSMGLASYFFTKNVDRTWRLLENLEAGMIGMNTGNQSAAESPFGGIKESGYGKESGKDVAVAEYLITKTGTMTLDEFSAP